MSKPARWLFAGVLAVVLGGCASATPIRNLALPPVTIIEGEITKLDESGFQLRDSSDAIYVRARLPDGKKLNIAVGEKVKVFGNLQGGPERIFDGYVVRRANGEQITRLSEVRVSATYGGTSLLRDSPAANGLYFRGCPETSCVSSRAPATTGSGP